MEERREEKKTKEKRKVGAHKTNDELSSINNKKNLEKCWVK